MNETTKQRLWGASAALVAIAMVGFLLVSGSGEDGGNAAFATTSETPAEQMSEDELDALDAECGETWAMPGLDHGGFRVTNPSVQAILDAQTDEDARKATAEAVNIFSRDAPVLAGNIQGALKRHVDPTTLVDENGCATPEAVAAAAELETALLITSRQVTPDENGAAAGYNTGVNENGEFVAAAHAGIGGNTKSVKIVLADGTVIFILGRCGNLVTLGPPPLPTGPTDNPQPTPTTHGPGPTPPPTVPPPTVPPPPTTQPGKDYANIPEEVKTPVTPETVRPPDPNQYVPEPPPPPPSAPGTTLVPDVPSHPECPGGYCPSHPTPPSTAAPPVTQDNPAPVPSTPTPPPPPPSD